MNPLCVALKRMMFFGNTGWFYNHLKSHTNEKKS